MKPSALLMPALLSASLLAGPSHAAFNDDKKDGKAESEKSDRLDMVITPWQKDGKQGAIFEFNPDSIPGVRCVVFAYGPTSGMQCFPKPERQTK